MPVALGLGVGRNTAELVPTPGPLLLAATLLGAAVYLVIRAVRAARRRVLYLAAAALLRTSGITSIAGVVSALASHQ